jgi:hypothetical protein
MSHRAFWPLLGFLLLAGLIVGLTLGNAQPFRDGPAPGMDRSGPPGRWVVARVKEHSLILLDTATGDLFEARDADIKPYSERHRTAPPLPPPVRQRDRGEDKDRPPESRDRDKDRPLEIRDKDRARDKDRPRSKDTEDL